MAERNVKLRILEVVGIALVGLFMVSAGSANAEIDRELRCRVGKFKGLVKEFRDKAQCYQKALKRSGLVDQSCLNRAERKRKDFFGRLHGSGICPANVSDWHYGEQIDAFFQGLSADLAPKVEKAKIDPAIPSPPGDASASPAVLATPGAK